VGPGADVSHVDVPVPNPLRWTLAQWGLYVLTYMAVWLLLGGWWWALVIATMLPACPYWWRAHWRISYHECPGDGCDTCGP